MRLYQIESLPLLLPAPWTQQGAQDQEWVPLLIPGHRLESAGSSVKLPAREHSSVRALVSPGCDTEHVHRPGASRGRKGSGALQHQDTGLGIRREGVLPWKIQGAGDPHARLSQATGLGAQWGGHVA